MHMSSDDSPLISVLMGILYKNDDIRLLKRSIDSILNQTYGNIELIICDDGSSCEARNYVNSCGKLDSRIRIVRGLDRTDLAPKLNACLKESKGEFIARMDDDDYSMPNRLMVQLNSLLINPDISFVGSQVSLIENGKSVGVRILPEFPEIRDFYMTQPFVHPSLLFRREALLDVEGYSESIRQIRCEDYDLLLRLYAKGHRGMNLQEPLLEYTLPALDRHKNSNKLMYCWNESYTRFFRFKELNALPETIPYIIKPLVFGMLPYSLKKWLKKQFQ